MSGRMELPPNTGLSGTPISKWADALNHVGRTIANNEREAQYKEIAGNDQMLLNRLMKYGIHKFIRLQPGVDDCYICEVYGEDSPIHLKGKK